MNRPSLQRLREVALLFLKLGTTSFGGPAAHTAMMHLEIVERRKWLNDQEFLDVLGAANLIPGPNSTEMAIHIGFLQAGWLGLISAGVCFITPAMMIVLALAWIYVRFGSAPQAQWLLYGIKPVVIAIIVQAIWTLSKKAAKNILLAVSGLLILILYFFFHFNEIILLLGGGVIIMFLANLQKINGRSLNGLILPHLMQLNSLQFAALAAIPYNLSLLFLTFLKIGAILYGSGYVLIAFLRADFVTRLGWLTDQQLIDAVAVGQVTPGPLFTSATFIGYILGGVPGALLATLGIFLPSFVFVAISNPLIPKMRNSLWVASFLDGINIASLSLMTVVTFQLGTASLIDLQTILIALISFGILLRFKINPTWLVAGGAFMGLVLELVR
jgi:chromate transporter